MNAEKFIAQRIVRKKEGRDSDKGSISRPIVKIAVTGIALGVAVMLLTVAIVRGFKEEIVARITGLTTHIAISNAGISTGGEPAPVTIGNDTLSMLRAIPGVTHVQPVAFKNGLLKTDQENEGMMLKGVGREYDFSFLGSHLIAGRLPEFPADEPSKDILVSSTLADRLGIKPGDRISAWFVSQYASYDSTAQVQVTRSDQRSRRFTVCGIFNSGFAEYDDRLCVGDIRQVRRLNVWPEDAAGSYELSVGDFSKVDEVREAIEDVLSFSYQVSTVKEVFSNIFIWLDKLDVNGVIIIVLMVLVAVVNMITALLILILERSSMIGLLKSMGLANISVRRVFLRVSMHLTWRGLLWGNIAGLLLIFIQQRFNLVKLDSDTYYVDHVAVDLSWLHFVLLNAGTVVTCVAMLWLPTLIIGRLTPVRTLKWD